VTRDGHPGLARSKDCVAHLGILTAGDTLEQAVYLAAALENEIDEMPCAP
jgi:ribulose-5-phosphate 4-epimerase/fuculose-1-phosphate aldolase